MLVGDLFLLVPCVSLKISLVKVWSRSLGQNCILNRPFIIQIYIFPEAEEDAESDGESDEADFDGDESLPESCESMRNESKQTLPVRKMKMLLQIGFLARHYRIFTAGSKYVKRWRKRSQLYGLEWRRMKKCPNVEETVLQAFDELLDQAFKNQVVTWVKIAFNFFDVHSNHMVAPSLDIHKLHTF